ncbi:MAG: amidohydrolase [Chloroflexi bacterium]|nr:amidohydrolase [Chloroflexota bacterium]
MAKIIDSHAHTFPYMGGASGFGSAQEHLRRIQRGVYGSINPHIRKRDQEPVTEPTLWDGKNSGPAGLRDVGFRVAKYGCFEWTVGGEDLSVQYFAPSLMDQTSTAEYMVAEMDYAGVGMAVLQNHATYGLLNDFFTQCVRKYPDRYIGLAGVSEAEAHTDRQLSELSRCVTDLGLRGVFYQVGGFWQGGYRDREDDRKYDPFWAEVRRLGLVVFWDPSFGAEPTAADYTLHLERMLNILERHPGIPSCIAQALPLGLYAAEGRYLLPEVVHELGKLPNVTLEIAYPITYGRKWEYPYEPTWPLIHQLYDWFGPETLVWGSDMPNINRFCTYRQSYEYLRHCDFLSAGDLDLFLGGNVARLFRLPQS